LAPFSTLFLAPFSTVDNDCCTSRSSMMGGQLQGAKEGLGYPRRRGTAAVHRQLAVVMA
jgi:hypothetical protein